MNKGIGIYPEGLSIALDWKSLIRRSEAPPLFARASSRMVRLAANLKPGQWVGWQMTVPQQGMVRMTVFGAGDIKESDLFWISEDMATVFPLAEHEIQQELPPAALSHLVYEGFLPASHGKARGTIGFDQPSSQLAAVGLLPRQLPWPLRFCAVFDELVDALRVEGGTLRYLVGPATPKEQQRCATQLAATWQPCNIDINEYLGTPVQARLVFLLPLTISARTQAIISECVPGLDLRLAGKLDAPEGDKLWRHPLEQAPTLPDIAARILACEPRLGSVITLGIRTHQPAAREYPARHTPSQAQRVLQIGQAKSIFGLDMDIGLSEADLKRHWQIVGQTGTGKSSLLLSVMKNAVAEGYGMTFFDPHGSTINTLMTMIPKRLSSKVRVIRIGDLENPVPMNMWNTNDPKQAESTIADLSSLFGDIFDPDSKGYVGPRWERMFGITAFTAIAILGKRASFESIVALARNKNLMETAATAIRDDFPDVADALMSEHVENNSRDYEEVVAWFVSKFQRLTSVAQLRNTLGAGDNALDFDTALDTNIVTLVDLGLPTIGTHAARVVGTMLLQQLWTAALKRKHRNQTHLVVLDEAQLFQTSPLPQMLAEARKFGLALMLAHQHNGQLSYSVREALSANSANFSAFRMSPGDAELVADRIDIKDSTRELSRMDAFLALTTCSIDGHQTPTFTLRVPKPVPVRNGEKISREIEQNSIETLVEPYRKNLPIRKNELNTMIRWAAASKQRKEVGAGKGPFGPMV